MSHTAFDTGTVGVGAPKSGRQEPRLQSDDCRSAFCGNFSQRPCRRAADDSGRNDRNGRKNDDDGRSKPQRKTCAGERRKCECQDNQLDSSLPIGMLESYHDAPVVGLMQSFEATSCGQLRCLLTNSGIWASGSRRRDWRRPPEGMIRCGGAGHTPERRGRGVSLPDMRRHGLSRHQQASGHRGREVHGARDGR